jgi:hypothetical protein
MQRPSLRSGALLGVAGLILALGGAPLLASAADHLDAPALGHVSSGSSIDLVSTHGDRDIADTYVFNDATHTRTVFALTTNPAINLFGGSFGTNVRYIINVDRNGDAVQDLAYVWRFGAAGTDGSQSYTVTRYTGSNARSLASGVVIGWGSTGGTGIGTAKDGAKVFAGVRADPFFFDLLGFEGTVLGVGSTQLGTGGDFFANLNINGIVLEVPNGSIGASHIGVWSQTTYWENGAWHAADQMGRPAINTVFNNKYVAGASVGAEKDLFNATPPSKMRTADGGVFRNNIIGTLTNIDGLLGLTPGCSDWDAGTAGAIADFLLPDVLTYTVGSTADGTTFNGRAPADDVIDAELAVTTHGCVTSDNVGPHTYLSSFPYLNVPH